MARIFGIGIDAIETARIAKLINHRKQSFSLRVFTENEIAYCESKKNKAQHYAARFAAKEALMKALGTGKQLGLSWREIEINHDELGRPGIKLSGRALEIAQEKGIKTIHLSLTHLKELALAVVVLEAVKD
ncbi:MAG: holo-ACP synthase [Candidatus Aminicenantes bacterium]|nr:holo-ACP synthase [Candidatus Aminicenantes bacterium]